MSRYRNRDHRYGENYYKHFRNGKLIKPEDDPFMHFQRRKSFFADNPELDDVAKSFSTDSFDDREYEELLSKYSDGGTYSSDGRAMENQKQVQNVKEKINSMKKKFQSLAMVCDYVEGMEKYEQALETDPESKMVKELSHKLEKLKSTPKIHTNELSYAATSGNNAEPKQYGVSLADKRRQKAMAATHQVPSAAASRNQSRASSPSRATLNVPSIRLRESASPSRCQLHHVHRDASPHQHLNAHSAHHAASPHRFITVPSRSRNCSTSISDTRDVATQVGRARISSDSDDEKQRDSGVSTHDEDEERINKRKKIDNRLKRELLKPKFYLNESGNLVRISSDDSLADVTFSEGLPPKPPVATASATPASAAAVAVDAPPPPTLRIYYDFVSSACRALYIFLKMAAVDFKAHPVQLRAGDHFQPEFEKLSPARRLPVMDDGGFILREAMPICRYIAEKRGLSKRWCHCEGGGAVAVAGKGEEDDDSNVFLEEDKSEDVIKSRAVMDEYLSWHQSHLRPACLQLFTQATLTPILSGQPPDFRRLRALKTELDKHCQYLENVFLQRGEYIGGHEVGICDLFAVCELMQPYAAGFDVRQSSLRRVRQWIERVKRETRPFFDEANAEIMKIWETKGRYVIDEYDDYVAHCDCQDD